MNITFYDKKFLNFKEVTDVLHLINTLGRSDKGRPIRIWRCITTRGIENYGQYRYVIDKIELPELKKGLAP